MTGQQRAIRWLAAGVLVLWCGVFLRAENTEKSMVRALILTQPTVAAQNWTVSLLYQFPEAAADASDAAARVQLCTGHGNTLQTALTEAERGLPRKASYRLCEYLLLNSETTLKTIRQAETVLKKRSRCRACLPGSSAWALDNKNACPQVRADVPASGGSRRRWLCRDP